MQRRKRLLLLITAHDRLKRAHCGTSVDSDGRRTGFFISLAFCLSLAKCASSRRRASSISILFLALYSSRNLDDMKVDVYASGEQPIWTHWDNNSTSLKKPFGSLTPLTLRRSYETVTTGVVSDVAVPAMIISITSSIESTSSTA